MKEENLLLKSLYWKWLRCVIYEISMMFFLLKKNLFLFCAVILDLSVKIPEIATLSNYSTNTALKCSIAIVCHKCHFIH